MKISGIIEEANDVADKYNLQLVEIDRTDNIISLVLLIDNELFIQIYGNIEKVKLSILLSFLKREDCTGMILKAVNTIVILLILLMNIYLLMRRNQYKNLLGNL